jgi:8-oxo-dGTP diphosphatase
LPFTYEYPRPAVSADTVVIDLQNKTLLLIQRKNDPFAGTWALPGGFMDMEESADVAAIRELQEETGLKVKEVKQIGAYSAVDRDPRGRVVTIAFLAFASQQESFEAADDAEDARWFPIDQLPALAFDHAQIVADGLAICETIR